MAQTAKAKPGKSPGKKKQNKDKFGLIAGITVVVLLAGGMGAYFLIHKPGAPPYESHEEYAQIPMVVVEANSQVARLQVAVQVAEKDHEWLARNKAKINQIVEASAREIDPGTLRTNEGRLAALDYLKDTINTELKVEKVQAVLYSDVIVEEKVFE